MLQQMVPISRDLRIHQADQLIMALWLVRSLPDLRALALDIVSCYWAKQLTLTVPLSTQVYKWVPANLMLGVTLRWTTIPSMGKWKYSESLHATEAGISSGLIGHLARMQTLPTYRAFI